MKKYSSVHVKPQNKSLKALLPLYLIYEFSVFSRRTLKYTQGLDRKL